MNNHGTKYNVLFLGNGNAARSIMAESLLNREGREKFHAYSAGINAHTEIDPRAADLLKRSHIDIVGARPKNWNEFAGDEAPRFDFVFTVCEGARSAGPIRFGRAARSSRIGACRIRHLLKAMKPRSGWLMPTRSVCCRTASASS